MTSMTVFLSDLHLGTSAETNWFQKDVHTDLVKNVLDFIIQNSELVKDVVVLGDWFELWNYSPMTTVPRLEEIFRCNPSLFRKTSDRRDFISVMESIKGDFRFVNGEHDMMVRLKDLNSLFAEQTDCRVLPGHGSFLEKDPVANTYFSSGQVWAEHGNQQDLFNRPAINEENRCRPLPIGYFLNRLFCFYVEKQISSMHRRDASYLTESWNSGEKSLGMKTIEFFDEVIRKTIKQGGANAAKIILDNLMARNRSVEIEFNMRTEGFGDVSCRDIPKYYQDLIDSENLLESLHESEVASSGLGRYALRHFQENPSTRLILMGHTHQARFEICGTGQPRLYVNSGFLCPSSKDMESGHQLPSFVVVKELAQNKIEVRQKFLVGRSFDVVDGPGLVLGEEIRG